MGASEPYKSDTWENRKKHTIEFLRTAPKEVLFISCADKLDNITSIEKDILEIGEAAWTKFKRPKEKQKWYYESLANVFLSRVDDNDTSRLFNELKAVVDRVFK